VAVVEVIERVVLVPVCVALVEVAVKDVGVLEVVGVLDVPVVV